ncbi:hypothetical protein MIND_00795100 [Mycena indigotica]|uniref:Uncharacterized protein n=1 Tax=Mycena indigotica TaxID=2126181 RepID=A0A8H6W1P7_9AGAR|nr:uncharacterized protein MIND_00795100 [Mycena indigotica]KAF7302279.1 hypothetical protein MIND_00795100 [Mycena indigotica]
MWFSETFIPSYPRSAVALALTDGIDDIVQDLSPRVISSIRARLCSEMRPLNKVQILFSHLDAQCGNIDLVRAFQEALLLHGRIEYMVNGDLLACHGDIELDEEAYEVGIWEPDCDHIRPSIAHPATRRSDEDGASSPEYSTIIVDSADPPDDGRLGKETASDADERDPTLPDITAPRTHLAAPLPPLNIHEHNRVSLRPRRRFRPFLWHRMMKYRGNY